MSLLQADLDRYLGQPSPIEPYLREILRGVDKPVIFDIGACEGEDSIRYARLFPGAHILSVEALPANQELLKANLAKYGVSADLVPVALSNRSGTVDFNVSAGWPPDLFSGEDWNYGNKSSSLLPPAGKDPMHGWIVFSGKITVPCDTLAAVCAARGMERVDFIHMDVQGAEGLVLEGAMLVLPRVRALWLEVSNEALYQGQMLRTEIEAMLRAQGFELAFEVSRGVEGDQLYLNTRFSSNRLALARWKLRRFWARVVRKITPRRSGA